MDRSVIPEILRELNLHENDVANIYNYGSWVYGTNSPISDRDLLIVTRTNEQKPLEFQSDFDYFHNFELHKLWNQFDVCVHSAKNFQTLLEKSYLVALECIFLPDEFKIKEEIDFRQIYLESYYNQRRLKQVAFYENRMAIGVFNERNDSDPFFQIPTRSSTWTNESEAGRTYLFKNLFHGLRYLDTAEQLIRTRSIYDFRRVSHFLPEMKEIRGDSFSDENMLRVLEYVKEKSVEMKKKLDDLVPTNEVKGTFEAHVTFECSHRTDETIKAIQKKCENSKFKLIFIELNTHSPKSKLNQLMTSSYHCGEYPSIVKRIDDEVSNHFRDFNIIRIKIESLASNEGVPETTAEKMLFWDLKTNYFEFHYKVSVRTNQLEKLKNVCQRFYAAHLHLSRNAFKQVNETEVHYMITMRHFTAGRTEAFALNDQIVQYLTNQTFAPLKVVREFVVYDTHVDLDQGWN